MAKNVILARMGEITLKGLNRGKFEIQLKSNLKYRLRNFGKLSIYQSQSRIWIEDKHGIENPNFADEESSKEILKAVTQVFGIVSASLARKFEGDLDSIKENSLEYVKGLLREHPEYTTFKVKQREAISLSLISLLRSAMR